MKFWYGIPFNKILDPPMITHIHVQHDHRYITHIYTLYPPLITEDEEGEDANIQHAWTTVARPTGHNELEARPVGWRVRMARRRGRQGDEWGWHGGEAGGAWLAPARETMSVRRCSAWSRGRCASDEAVMTRTRHFSEDEGRAASQRRHARAGWGQSASDEVVMTTTEAVLDQI